MFVLYSASDNSDLHRSIRRPGHMCIGDRAYLFYGEELKQYNFVVSVRKDFDGTNIGLSGTNIVTKLYGGSIHASDSDWDAHNSYLYAGASADLIYALSPNASVGAGLNFAYNKDDAVSTAGRVFWYRFFANFRF